MKDIGILKVTSYNCYFNQPFISTRYYNTADNILLYVSSELYEVSNRAMANTNKDNRTSHNTPNNNNSK